MSDCRQNDRRCDGCGLTRHATGVWRRGVWHAADYLGWRDVERVTLAPVAGRCLCQQCRSVIRLDERAAERARLKASALARAGQMELLP